MSSLYNVAECIASLWRLSPGHKRAILDAGGIVDRALEDVLHLLPTEIQQQLHFSNSSVGRRCLEWPEIANKMAEGGLVTCEGPTFTTIRLNFSNEDAVVCLYTLGLDEAQRTAAAIAFYKAVQHHEHEALKTI